MMYVRQEVCPFSQYLVSQAKRMVVIKIINHTCKLKMNFFLNPIGIGDGGIPTPTPSMHQFIDGTQPPNLFVENCKITNYEYSIELLGIS